MSNDKRIERTHRAISVAYDRKEGNDVVVTDMLTDLRHWCDCYAVDFEQALSMSEIHYEAEAETYHCDDCDAEVKDVIGCPDGAEVCQSCFDEGRH